MATVANGTEPWRVVVLQRSEYISAADWLRASDADPQRLITFGPAGFEAYARLRYIPGPDRPGMSEADVQPPDDHPTDMACRRHVKTDHGVASEF